MGDTVHAGSLEFTARVMGAGPGAPRARRLHAVRAQGRRAAARRAGHQRRLQLRVPQRGPRPLPAAGAARQRDRGGLEPDLPRPAARALSATGRSNAAAGAPGPGAGRLHRAQLESQRATRCALLHAAAPGIFPRDDLERRQRRRSRLASTSRPATRRRPRTRPTCTSLASHDRRAQRASTAPTTPVELALTHRPAHHGRSQRPLAGRARNGRGLRARRPVLVLAHGGPRCWAPPAP